MGITDQFHCTILTEIHGKQYTIASSAAIRRAPHFEDFGHDATSQATMDLFNGKSDFQHVDTDTAAIFQALKGIW